MADDRRRKPDTFSPVPSPDMGALARNITRIHDTVNAIDSSLTLIKEDILPPVQRAAQEARDGVLRLDERVRTLESTPPPPHSCTETDRQATQDAAISTTEAKVGHNSKLLWWLIGSLVVIGGSIVSFAFVTGSTSARTTASLEATTSTVSRHEIELDTLQKDQARDRETFLREIRALPTRVSQTVQAAVPPADQIGDAADELPLRPAERRQLIDLLERARARKQQNVDR